MIRRYLTLAGLGCVIAAGGLILATPEAHANPLDLPATPLTLTCERRTEAHMSEHGGRMADNAYHIARGELPSCDYSSDDAGSSHDNGGDDRVIPRRDSPFHVGFRDLF